MPDRTNTKLDRKVKKSYTLSPESVAFLEAMRKKRRAGSVSAILEEILQAVRREHERAPVELAVADYYGSLSTEEAKEQAQWGEFALREFPFEDRA
jgi:hypothetical protein